VARLHGRRGVSGADPFERFMTSICLREACAVALTTVPFCMFPDARLACQDAERLKHVVTCCTRQYLGPLLRGDPRLRNGRVPP